MQAVSCGVTGGGGGSGYYGGGSGGASDWGCFAGHQTSGAGGSGYIAPSVQDGATAAGENGTPPETSSPYYIPGAAAGGTPAPPGAALAANHAGDGLVILAGPNVGNCASAPICSENLNQNSDGTVTLQWSSQNASIYFINNVGYVPASGSAHVPANTDYSGYVSGAGGAATCLPTTNTPLNGLCTSTSMMCGADGNLHDGCGNTTACKYGCSTQTNTCNTSCAPTDICDASETRVVNSCTGAVLADCGSNAQICEDGQCAAVSIGFQPFQTTGPVPFKASGHIQAAPSLVRSGEHTSLYWNVTNASSCMVTGTNGLKLGGLFSGSSGISSGAINGQTTFTLQCTALSGATPSSINESVTVNLVPNFQEM